MSRNFRIWFSAEAMSRADADRIVDAIEDEWSWSPGVERVRRRDLEVFEVRAQGDGTLGGGYTDEQFARDLQHRVWKALQGYVPVFVQTVCTDPNDGYGGSELEFALARDGGLLLRECEECCDPMPFGRLDKLCEQCRAEDDAYRAEAAAAKEE